MSITRRQFTLAASVLAAVAASTRTGAAQEPSSAPAQNARGADAYHDMSSMPEGWIGSEQIAMLVYPGLTALDLVAPQYAFAALMGASVHLVAKTRDTVVSDTGIPIVPTMTFEECPADLDILFAPGGSVGTLAAMRDETTTRFLADRGQRAGLVTSVCTGSLLLGAAGLLDGYRATSHWAARDLLTMFGAEPVNERVVFDRNRITGAGVTAGMDFGLAIVERLRDRTYAEATQLGAEYAPEPPFSSGTPEAASEHVRAIMDGMFVGFRRDVVETARSVVGDQR